MEENEYPVELFEDCNTPKKIKNLKEKLDLLKESTLFTLPEYKNHYLAGVKYLHTLVNRLKSEDGEEFWKCVDISELVEQLNNVNNLSKLLSRTIFNLDCDVEVVHIIIKDYFQRIKKRLNIN